MKPPAKGRADLVRWMQRLEPDRFERLARRMGYEPRAKTTQPKQPVDITGSGTAVFSPLTAKGTASVTPTLTHYRLTARRPLPRAPEPPPLLPPEELPAEREWDPLGPPPPLLPWSRLWPFLRLALGELAELHRPDLPRLVDELAQGRHPRRLPRQRARRWAPRCQLILDGDERLFPFQADFHDLLRRLEPLRGASGLEVLRFEQGPEGPARPWKNSDWGLSVPYRLPEPGARVLILGDLGALGPAMLGQSWMRLGRRMRARGIHPVLLGPCPARWWDPEWAKLYFPVVWDSTARLPPGLRVPRNWPLQRPDPELAVRRDTGAGKLLSLLSAAVFVEPELLRHLRLALPPGVADVGSELAAWSHPEVRPGGLALLPGSEASIARLRANLARVTREQLLFALDLIARAHRDQSRAVIMEERANRARLLGLADPAVERFLEEVRQALEDTGLDESARAMLQGWAARGGRRRHPEDWVHSRRFELIWYLAHREAIARGEAVLPEGFDLERAHGMRGDTAAPATWRIQQQGAGLSLLADSGLGPDVELARPVAALSTRAGALQVVSPGPSSTLPLRVGARLPATQSALVIHTGGEELELAPLGRPPWGRSMGRDAKGLFVELAQGDGRRVYWLDPGAYPVDRGHGGHVLADGCFMDETQYLDLMEQGFTRPDWARSIGPDQYGVYAELSIKDVTQRLRWIPPGEFLMGSPQDEPGRYDDEGPRHSVTLTQGFWLFDTPVTQALWQAVMGRNPSRFQSPERPVEQVSWDDVQGFINRLERQVPGLGLRLPSEAQWEYACRAGTRTAVYAGDIDIKGENNVPALDPIAWYGGNSGQDFKLENGYDSSDWPKKQYPHDRAGTHPVKGKQPNDWGLYDMLGNVWEWCGDWYGSYSEETVVDPKGPEEGERRVLRGGSWIDGGRYVRSAFRYDWEPDDRYGYFGFRLARGPELQPGGEQGRTGTAGSEGRTEGSVGQVLRRLRKKLGAGK